MLKRNDEQDDFRENWKDMPELMQSEASRILYTITAIFEDDQMC